MKMYHLILVSLIALLTIVSMPVSAGFDFCSGNASEGGSGHFQQEILLQDIVEVGELPAGIAGVEIHLTSAVDVDIQLYDKNTGEKLVHWPNGVLAGGGLQTMLYHGIKIEWSGYNGDGTGKGNEFIRIANANDASVPTDRAFVMKVYGYRAGLADVNYSWTGADVEGCQVSESGSGSFQQQILQNAIVDVGEIPVVGVENLVITLSSSEDVDVQLYDTDNNVAIVAWPDGLLSGSGDNGTKPEVIVYKEMTISWSGYNGDGSGKGHEYIKISGVTSQNLLMKAFGYRSGIATVNYNWGEQASGGSEEDIMKAELLVLVNQVRSLGQVCGGVSYPPVAQVSWHAKLYQSALRHAKDMATNDFFDHTGSDGSNAGTRVSATGYSWSTVGENIAAGYSTAASVMQGWIDSAGHCRNIMNPAFTQIGVAKASGGSYGIYWAQVFAAQF